MRVIQYSRDAESNLIGRGVLGRPVKPGDDRVEEEQLRILAT